MSAHSETKHTPGTDEHVFKARNGRTYRVAPSQYGGYSVVEIMADGSRGLVRNVRERDAVFSQSRFAPKVLS